MDSLLANYASSDGEDEEQVNEEPSKPSSASSLFSSLPKPQSSSALFSSLPPPKSHPQLIPKTTSTNREEQEDEKGLCRDPNSGSSVSSGLFFTLPAPKSQSNSVPNSTSSGSGSTTHKRVVQFRPPLIQSSFISDDKDEDDEYVNKKKPQVINPTGSFKSFISSMPAPTNSATLGAMSGSCGSGRRAIVDTSVSSLNSDVHNTEKEAGISPTASNVHDSSVSVSLGAAEDQFVSVGDATNWGQPGEGYVGYVGYESHESYVNYAGYENYGSYGYDGIDGSHDQSLWAAAPSTWVAPEASGAGIVETVAKMSGKRGRNQIPTEIVEVSQDELMKNRPRQDQVKMTGIAFGPAYQPAPSGGGKPTKLHKRKHQIGSLYFDMKQKEMELSERRAKGMLTKAETQAKYGW